MTNIFEHKENLDLNYYPEMLEFADALNNSFWTFREWSFSSDVNCYHTELSEKEKSAIKNTLLAISQIELKVKDFYISLVKYINFPTAKMAFYSITENEVRHTRGYSALLHKLGLQDEFNNILEVPAIQGRVKYLTKYTKSSTSNENVTFNIALFSIFTEYVSLFSQFAVIKSFNKFKNVLKDTDNLVSASRIEEICHGLFGVYLINQIKKENPEWFDEKFYAKLYEASAKAIKAEAGIIDWIFEQGELDFISKDALKEYIKSRVNEALEMIGGTPNKFEVNKDKLKELNWFIEETVGDTSVDFFHKRSVNYVKSTQSFDELF